MANLEPLTLQEVEYIAHWLVKEMMDFSEPIPEFETRYPGKLEACIEQPFQEFGGRELYPTLAQKTSQLFYSVIKNHPFANGNKRMAIAIMFTFLFKNGYWMNIPTNQLYELSIKVAKSHPDTRGDVLQILEKFFQSEIVASEQDADRE
jgi:death-on-curing family protein